MRELEEIHADIEALIQEYVTTSDSFMEGIVSNYALIGTVSHLDGSTTTFYTPQPDQMLTLTLGMIEYVRIKLRARVRGESEE